MEVITKVGTRTCRRCSEDNLTWVQPWNTDKMVLSPGPTQDLDAPVWVTEDGGYWEVHRCPEVTCRDCGEPILWVKTDQGWRPSGAYTMWCHLDRTWVDQATRVAWPVHECPSYPPDLGPE